MYAVAGHTLGALEGGGGGTQWLGIDWALWRGAGGGVGPPPPHSNAFLFGNRIEGRIEERGGGGGSGPTAPPPMVVNLGLLVR